MDLSKIKPLSFRTLATSASQLDAGIINAEYQLAFQDQEARSMVDVNVHLAITKEETVANLAIEGCKALNPEEALDKLADWLEAFAITLRARKAPVIQIPVYSL